MPPPLLLVSDYKGNIFEIPGLYMAGASLNRTIVPDDQSLSPMPDSSSLFTLPGRIAIGYDPLRSRFITVNEHKGTPVYATSAFMPPGYICTLNSAYEELPDAPVLPLYCYSAVGWKKGRFHTAGYRIDRQHRHDITEEDFKKIAFKTKKILKRFPNNRIVSHLISNCVLKYKCPNACNFMLGRWECPVPVSNACNSQCFGCISSQPGDSGFPSSQDRIEFLPTINEIIEYIVPHLKKAPDPIASFGQGCEGEPLIQASLIEEAIHEIRKHTGRGIININTNASMPYAVERLCKAGLNSMRVSINSAQPQFYASYYRPRNYSFNDVLQSITIAKQYNVWVSLNYLLFPGFTDSPSEMNALEDLIRSTGINMIQTRNLNIDPLWFRKMMKLKDYGEKPIGIISWIERIKNFFPDLLLGYFNPNDRTIKAKSK